jgi:hypothetical protein
MTRELVNTLSCCLIIVPVARLQIAILTLAQCQILVGSQSNQRERILSCNELDQQ